MTSKVMTQCTSIIGLSAYIPDGRQGILSLFDLMIDSLIVLHSILIKQSSNP